MVDKQLFLSFHEITFRYY